MLNKILRIAWGASNFSPIANPKQLAPYENDHFIEVQHFVDVLIVVLKAQGKYNNWFNEPIGHFIDLSTFVNEHRNLFQIPSTMNQQKKNVPIANYKTNASIQTYLGWKVDYKGKQVTVKDMVKALLNDMAQRTSPQSELTRDVGKQLLIIMGW